jgi:murein L,D-transpeptidase YafK
MSARFCHLLLGLAILVMVPHPAAARSGFVDRVVIDKSDRTLKLLAGKEVFRTYFVALGAQPDGPKMQSGDQRTPEGVYSVIARQPRSEFHRGLLISYPNSDDVARAQSMGVDPGGEIMIHGLPSGYDWVGPRHRRKDWTEGCIAVTNQEIDEIWQLVDIGTPVEIRP